MAFKVVAVIPAHLESKRFPNKVLQEVAGEKIIDRVIKYTKNFDFLDKIVLASDNKELEEYANKHKIEWFHMTDSVRCGSERSFVYFKKDSSYDYYLSIPSDEPIIDSNEVNRAWSHYTLSSRMGPQEIITFYCDFYCKEDLMSRLSCKIVSDYSDRALYFSRCVIPTSKDPDDNWRTPLGVFKKHIGIFVFPKTWLEMYGKNMWDDRKSILADTESLEQNRFLEFGSLVSLLKIKHVGFGIDIRDQIEILENRIKSLGIQT